MTEIIGYFDGNTVQLLEDAPAVKQKVIVTFMDDDEAAFDDLPVGALSLSLIHISEPTRR